MKGNKRKKEPVVTALVLAVVVFLAGTLVWAADTSGATESTGEACARLHDDFDGVNKDVYVENYADRSSGTTIFTRVRLDEYMETGPDAGAKDKTDKKAQPLVEGTRIQDTATWTTHIPSEEGTESCKKGFHEYWTWTMGGQTTYMPTFNKNTDSKKADINGTLAGKDGDGLGNPDKRYSDYVDYTKPENASKEEKAVYDIDDDDSEEETPVEGVDVRFVQEKHTVKKTLDSQVMTMEEWVDGGSVCGPYWVYDTDGWAYWAEALQPGEATGLLLDNIEMTRNTEDSSYYAINIVAQFTAADDWGKSDNTGFYAPSEDRKPSAAALQLLEKVAAARTVVSISTAEHTDTIAAGGDTLTLRAVTTLNEIPVPEDEVTWSVVGNTSEQTKITEANVLTVGEDETSEKLTVCAKSKMYSVIGKKNIEVELTPIEQINKVKPGSAETVEIDGIDWYVLAKDEKNERAMLWSKDMIPSWNSAAKRVFGTAETTNHWKGSVVQSWLNNEFKDSLTYLNDRVIETSITTRQQFDSQKWDTTNDFVFLLSEADLFGTFNGTKTSEAKDYTYNGQVLVEKEKLYRCGAALSNWYWLRSPCSNACDLADVSAAGHAGSGDYSRAYAGIRPALWVSLVP